MKPQTIFGGLASALVLLLLAVVALSRSGGFQVKGKPPDAAAPGGASRTTLDASASITPVQASDAWTSLRQRPLNLPAVNPGSPCPAAQGKQVSPDFGLALGKGPVYPVGLGSEGALYYNNGRTEGGWLFDKVLWIGDPVYNGPVLIRGHQIDGPNELRFEEGANPTNELLLNTDRGGSTTSNWSNWPSYTRTRAPGCYAYQVDGASFSEVIVFRVIDSLYPEPTATPGR